MISVVATHTLRGFGGAQLVCASAASAFETIGMRPVIATVSRFDPSEVLRAFGIDLSAYPRESLGIGMNMLGIYLRLLTWKPAARAVKRHGAGLLFTDNPNYRPLLKLRAEKGLSIIEYIHYPYEAEAILRSRGVRGVERDPYVAERYGRFPHSLYWELYLRIWPAYMRSNPFEDSDLVLTNSRWTSNIVEKLYGGRAEVLNPPIPPSVRVLGEEEVRAFDERKAQVIMLGRFSSEKRYEHVVKSLWPGLLRQVGGARLVIYGSAGSPSERSYLNRLRGLVEKLGLRGSVELRPNAPREEILGSLDMSRAYLHSTVNEHWGISIAEAMARGLPALIHMSGGSWSDLAGEGSYALGFKNEDEAVEKLARILTDERLWRKQSRRSLERSSQLALDNFAHKLEEILARRSLI